MDSVKVTTLKPNYEKLTPGNKQFDPLYLEIFEKYSSLQGETSQRITKHLEDKNFYLGEYTAHWDRSEQLGDINPIVNYAAAIDNKYADLLTAGETQGIEIQAPTNDEVEKGNASAMEALIYRILEHNNWPRKLHYGATNGATLGNTFFYVYWDPDKPYGGKKGSVCVETLSPFFVRVGFAKDNWDEIDYWIGESEMSPAAIKAKWDIDVAAAATIPATGQAGGSSPNAPFDGTTVEDTKTYNPMVKVIDFHDREKDVILIGDQTFYIKENKGNHGLYHIRNRTVTNEPWGYPDHYNIKGSVRLLNKLHSKAQEIIDYHAAPMIVDKGNVLQGRKIKNRSNVVVTTEPYSQGEGLEYLQWNGNTYPIDKQIETTLQSIYDLSEMPPAAFGSSQPGTYSGYALQIQMQPTLMRVKIKQSAEWGPKLIDMFRYMVQLVLDNDKGVGLPKDVLDYPLKIHWDSPIPKEDAREIQNAVALVTNKLSSKETAMQSLRVQDVQTEVEKIEAETMRDAETAAEAQKIMMESQMELQTQQAQPPIQPGQAPEQAFPEIEEDNRVTPQSAGLEGGESIAPTSTEGI